MYQKGTTHLLIVLAVVIIVVLVGTAYYLGKNSQNNVKISNEGQKLNSTPPSSAETKAETSKISPTISPIPDPTANWKTYTNKKYGYLVKYPSNLLINEFEESYAQYTEFTLGRDSSGNAYLANYTVTVAKGNFQAKDPASVNYLSADWTSTFYGMNVGDTKTAGTVTFKKSPSIKVAGQDAVVIQAIATGDNQTRYLLKNNGYVYMISDFANSADSQDFLSSFKFTN